MKSFITSLSLFLLMLSPVFGQTKISGKVTDQKKQPLPGVNIFIKDTYDGTTSDANGNFSFSDREYRIRRKSTTFSVSIGSFLNIVCLYGKIGRASCRERVYVLV